MPEENTDKATATDSVTVRKDRPSPARRRGDETADDTARDVRVNWVDGKSEKIADERSTAESFEGDVDKGERAEFAPRPWRETNTALDNREGSQGVTPESWRSEPQQVPGPEVGARDPRLDNRE